MMETHALMKKALYPLLLLPLLFCTQVMAETTAPGLSETELARTWIARQEIAALQRRYAQATDMMAGGGTSAAAKVSALYLQIFTADADMGVKDGPTFPGPEAWLELVKDRLGPLESAQHLIGSQLVEIQSLPDKNGDGGAATMRSYLQATHVEKNGTLERVLGIYHAKAVHTAANGWKLSEMTLEVLSTDTARRE